MLQWFGAFHSRISWFSVFVIGGNAQGRSKAVWFPPKHPSNWIPLYKEKILQENTFTTTPKKTPERIISIYLN